MRVISNTFNNLDSLVHQLISGNNIVGGNGTICQQDVCHTLSGLAIADIAEDMRGVRRLRGTGLVYDILVFQRQLATAIKFVDAQANDQQFVLDHVGKPMPGREGEWAALVREMAKRDNVACKFSGVVTEVGTGFDSVRRVFDTVLEAFGPNRMMWGSDWPVVTVKMAYCDWKELVDRLVSPLSESERMAILGATAARVYGLEGMK